MPNQNAFVKGRAISDNILMASELLITIRRIKRKGKGILAGLKLDMSKAYDRISWNFIKAVLIKMIFPLHWIHHF